MKRLCYIFVPRSALNQKTITLKEIFSLMNNGKTALGLDNNIGALVCYLANFICYLGVVYSIIVLVTDKSNKLPRFHAMQSILLLVAGIIGLIIVGIVGGTLTVVTGSSAIGSLAFLLYMAVGLGYLGGVIYCAIQGFQGNVFKLPIIGDLADKWSN
jgi:uncharacterized membrane protein